MQMIRNKNISTKYVRLLAIGLIFLFPLLSAYSVLRSLGIPSLFFPIVIYIIAIIAFLFWMFQFLVLRTVKITLSILLTSGIFLYISMIILTGWRNYERFSQYSSNYYAVVQTGLFYSMLCLLVGFNIDLVFNEIIYNKRIKKLALISMIILIFALLYSISLNYIDKKIFEIRYTIDYLAISDGVAVTSFAILWNINKPNNRKVIFIIALLIMLGTISRGSLLAFLSAILCWKFISYKRNFINMLRFVIAIFLGFIFLVFLSKNTSIIYDLLGYSRGARIIVGLLSDYNSFIANDFSMVTRNQVLFYGLKDLKNIWFFGSFMRDAKTGVGYIHNWLSFWVNYGLIPFFTFIGIYLISLYKCIYYYRKSMDKMLGLIILLAFYTLFQIVFFRAYVYSTVWLSMGALIRMYFINKYGVRNSVSEF